MNRRKRNAMPLLRIPGIVRVTFNILCVTLTNGLAASNHIRQIITNYAQTLHALRVLRCHGLPGDAVQTVYQATVVTKLLYACSTVHGAASLQPVTGNNAFLRHSKRWGFCTPNLPPFNDLIKAQEDQFFFTINHNPQHLLHYLLPPPSAASQSYDLRHRAQNRSLPDRAGHLVDSNFISRMIFKDIY